MEYKRSASKVDSSEIYKDAGHVILASSINTLLKDLIDNHLAVYVLVECDPDEGDEIILLEDLMHTITADEDKLIVITKIDDSDLWLANDHGNVELGAYNGGEFLVLDLLVLKETKAP
jgi:hypothetical protein